MSTLAPLRRPARLLRVLPPLATVAVIGAATVALHLRDPHAAGSWGECPSAALGFWCPGCGGLRAVNDLTDLRLVDAASSNVLLVALLPLLVLGLARWGVDAWTGTRREVSALAAPAAALLLAAMVAFTVLRNLPGLEWLAP